MAKQKYWMITMEWNPEENKHNKHHQQQNMKLDTEKKNKTTIINCYQQHNCDKEEIHVYDILVQCWANSKLCTRVSCFKCCSLVAETMTTIEKKNHRIFLKKDSLEESYLHTSSTVWREHFVGSCSVRHCRDKILQTGVNRRLAVYSLTFLCLRSWSPLRKSALPATRQYRFACER